ncbi:MAG: hypothetical protein WA782_15620 [Sulfitobacter sp.]
MAGILIALPRQDREMRASATLSPHKEGDEDAQLTRTSVTKASGAPADTSNLWMIPEP